MPPDSRGARASPVDVRLLRAGTGRKVHLARVGSSTGFCGRWLRAAAVPVRPEGMRELRKAGRFCVGCALPFDVAVALGVCCFVAWAVGA